MCAVDGSKIEAFLSFKRYFEISALFKEVYIRLLEEFFLESPDTTTAYFIETKCAV